jgi:hypothetical protein
LFGKIPEEVHSVENRFSALKKDGKSNFPACGWRVLRLILLDIESGAEWAVPYMGGKAINLLYIGVRVMGRWSRNA